MGEAGLFQSAMAIGPLFPSLSFLLAAAFCVRDYLHQIRTEFEALVAENAAKPEAERLPRSAFEIDVGLREMIAEVGASLRMEWMLIRAKISKAVHDR
eukprot:1159668-Pelagomonas_calceolata.AAC.9